MTTRHEFLVLLHQVLKPRIYLEIGVQHGWSLDLATTAEVAYGIDPHPQVQAKWNQVIVTARSADFFGAQQGLSQVDFGFIDGSHLFEDAADDFRGMLGVCQPNALVAFDDVLPYNQAIASRIQPPGDWTGDVWRVHGWIEQHYPTVRTLLVDTEPTGLLLCWDLGQAKVQPRPQIPILPDQVTDPPVPADVLDRRRAAHPGIAIQIIEEWSKTR